MLEIGGCGPFGPPCPRLWPKTCDTNNWLDSCVDVPCQYIKGRFYDLEQNMQIRETLMQTRPVSKLCYSSLA